jgi:hypothetical protein
MIHIRILAFSLILTLANFGAFSQQMAKPVYMNPDAPIADRARDLLKRMTLKEKVAQLESFTTKPVVSGIHLETAVEGDHIEPGLSTVVTFVIGSEQLSILNSQTESVLLPGPIDFLIGANSAETAKAEIVVTE